MVRLLLWMFSASLLTLLCVVNSSVVEGRSFVERATVAEICGAPNYYICSDGSTCCPNGFLCQDNGCVKAPDNTSNDPTATDVVIVVVSSHIPSKGPVLGAAAIAGIAAGGAIFLVAAGVAIYFCVRKRKIGKEVLKAYEDPSRNMYDQVVVEGKRISVVPVGPTQPMPRTETNLPPLSEVQELANMEAGLKSEGQQQQYQQEYHQQSQQYQPYQQQQQTYYNQNQEQIQQGTELSADQASSPPQAPAPYIPEPLPTALRVGSPVNPIRADSMGLIPVAVDTADGGQHPYQFRRVPSTIRHHSATPHYQNTEPIPQSSSPQPPATQSQPPVYYQPQTPATQSQPPVYYQPQTLATQSQPPVYYQPQAPSPPPRQMSPQQPPERYQSPQQPPERYQSPQQPPERHQSPQQPPERYQSPQQPPERYQSPQQPPERYQSPQQSPERYQSPQQPPERYQSPQQPTQRYQSPQQTPERHQSPQTYQTPQAAYQPYQQYQQEDAHRIPSPPNSYPQYPQQYPEQPPPSASPTQRQNQHSMHGHNPRNNSSWDYGR